MQVLVVVATIQEVGPLISEFGFTISDFSASPVSNCKPLTENCQLLVTGVGMVATAFALGKHLAANQYDLVLNLGIAGSFDRNISLGDLVEITKDTFAELGAEDDEEFLPIDKMGFGTGIYYPSANLSTYYNASNNFNNTFNPTCATAITVNTVHGNELSIQKVADRLHPQIESMEGAAFFYACREANVSGLQIRAVSNYVEKRNRDSWKIGLAIKNLNTFALEFVRALNN